MGDSITESLSRQLEAQEQSDRLIKLPPNIYTEFASYMQRARRITDSGGDDLVARLLKKQAEILQGMASQLLKLRLDRAKAGSPTTDLLPEEKYLFGFYGSFTKEYEWFLKSLKNGQPSFFTMAYKTEMSKKVTVRFLRNVGEIVGFDLKRYGPFHVHDLAVIPFGNAEVLVNNGDAAFVQVRG